MFTAVTPLTSTEKVYFELFGCWFLSVSIITSKYGLKDADYKDGLNMNLLESESYFEKGRADPRFTVNV